MCGLSCIQKLHLVSQILTGFFRLGHQNKVLSLLVILSQTQSRGTLTVLQRPKGILAILKVLCVKLLSFYFFTMIFRYMLNGGNMIFGYMVNGGKFTPAAQRKIEVNYCSSQL